MANEKAFPFHASAKWIWSDTPVTKDAYSEFYTEFDLDEPKATMKISVDSNYTLFINGVFVESGQYPDFPHYKVYDEIDISRYCHAGKNKLAIVVWYYGHENMSYYAIQPSLLFEVTSEGRLCAASGEDVLSRKSRAYVGEVCKLITVQLGYSFRYDCTAEDNWKEGELDGFAKSRVLDQDLPLYKRPIKKLVLKEKHASTVVKEEDGFYLYDLGEETVGYLSFRVKSECKQKLEIAFGEHIIDGKVRQRINGRDFSVEVTVGEGVTAYTNYFRRLGLRYLEIHSQEPLSVEELTVIPCDYPLTELPVAFEDSLVQRVYDTSVRTLILCMHEHYEDCPWREQALYAMDSRNQIICGYYAFGEYAFPRSCLYLMSKDNRSDGLLSICFPTTANLAIPSFSLHYFTEVYEYTKYSKDLTLIQEIMPKLESIMAVFLARRENGLVQNFIEKQHWNFYEWVDGLTGTTPAEKAVREDAMMNCLCSLALSYLGEMCEMLGLERDYSAIAKEINRAIRAKFYDAERGIYRMAVDDDREFELVNALAVLCGAARGEEADRICQMLADNRFIKTSLSMICFKYDALLKIDKARYAEVILDDINSKYKKMLDEGATAFWETEKGASDFSNAGSLCHGWSAMPVYYYHLLAQKKEG
ncbi:MAG: family 78 glycoside hydrolase catalytic domain [Clostridia bacterium]|nr:family 78 glycoside hydrolase catalytic domain [Clostridia bacterium]